VTKQDSKEYILEKTFFLLLTKGYNAVSITDIQAETGMSRGLLYHYFGSKEELFKAAGEVYLVSSFLINTDETKGYDLIGMMQYIIEKYTAISRQWRNYAGTGKITMANYDFLFYQMMRKEKEIEKKYFHMRREEEKAWTDAVNKSLSKGEIRPLLPAEKIAAHFILLLDGVWMQSTETNSISRYIRHTRQVLQDYYYLLKA